MNITVRDLLDAGVHFGHQLKRWNPRSKKYVFDQRHGISIIDLEKSYANLEKSCAYLEDLVASGGKVFFVGTKRQAQEIIREAGASTGMPFTASRWMGGALTNFDTIKKSIQKYRKLMEMENNGEMAKLHKKEAASLRRQMARLQRNCEGMVDLNELPQALFVVDTKKEYIAVAEANRKEIPVVALVDTNSDPTLVDWPIPGNDDAVKAIRIIVETVVEAIQRGLSQREARRESKAMKAEEQKEVAAEQIPEEGAAPAEPEVPTQPELSAEPGLAGVPELADSPEAVAAAPEEVASEVISEQTTEAAPEEAVVEPAPEPTPEAAPAASLSEEEDLAKPEALADQFPDVKEEGAKEEEKSGKEGGSA